MTRSWSILASALLLVLVVQDAQAQWNVARFEAGRSRMYTTFGLDPAMVGTVGFARVLPVMGHAFQLTGDVGMVTAGLDANDYRVRIGTQTSLVQWRSMRVTGSATFLTRGTENSIYRGVNFGADFTGTVGMYRNRWFASGEIGFDKAIVTHVRHTDWYRENYYADAKDGWYIDAGGTWHFGVMGGVTLGLAELVARGGWHRTERYNALATPAYASVGIGFGF